MKRKIKVNIIKNCPECGTSFKAYIKLKKIYCSDVCWGLNTTKVQRVHSKKRLSPETMVTLYSTGEHTLESIAKIAGVTRERVRQLIVLTVGAKKAEEYKENRRRKPTEEEIKKFNRIRKVQMLKSFGLWNWNYEKCTECGRTDREHKGKGLCVTCINRIGYRTNEKRRDDVRKSQKKYIEKNKKKIYEKNRQYYWNNLDKLREYAREYTRKNREECNLRALMGYYKRRNDLKKYNETSERIKELITSRKERQYEKK